MCGKLLRALLLGLVGCAAGCSPRDAPRSPRARLAEESARDNEIFDAVLNDLINNEDFNPVARGHGAKREQIILDDETYGGASPGLVERSPLGLTPAARSQLRDDVLRRNPPGQPFSWRRSVHRTTKSSSVGSAVQTSTSTSNSTNVSQTPGDMSSPGSPGSPKTDRRRCLVFSLGPAATVPSGFTF